MKEKCLTKTFLDLLALLFWAKKWCLFFTKIKGVFLDLFVFEGVSFFVVLELWLLGFLLCGSIFGILVILWGFWLSGGHKRVNPF